MQLPANKSIIISSENELVHSQHFSFIKVINIDSVSYRVSLWRLATHKTSTSVFGGHAIIDTLSSNKWRCYVARILHKIRFLFENYQDTTIDAKAFFYAKTLKKMNKVFSFFISSSAYFYLCHKAFLKQNFFFSEKMRPEYSQSGKFMKENHGDGTIRHFCPSWTIGSCREKKKMQCFFFLYKCLPCAS